MREGAWHLCFLCWGSSSCETHGSFCFQSAQNCPEAAHDQTYLEDEHENKTNYSQRISLSFYEIFNNVAPIRIRLPVIFISSSDLRDVLTHFDCVTEVLRDKTEKKAISTTAYYRFKSPLQDYWQGFSFCSSPNLSINRPSIIARYSTAADLLHFNVASGTWHFMWTRKQFNVLALF